MKNKFKILALGLFAFIASFETQAQEWTKAQLEVWNVVEDEWNKWKTKDIDGMGSILHEKYQGWNDEFPLPVSKAMTMDYFTTMKDAFKVEFSSLNPARIVVADNSAVVHYFFTYTLSFGEGDKKESKEFKGRIVEFYTKNSGKWQLLGDMMVHGDDDENDD